MLFGLSFLAGAQDVQPPASQEPEAQGVQQARVPSAKGQLLRAARDGQVEEVRALLMAGGDANQALWMASMSGQAQVAALALEFGAKLTGPDELGQRCLRQALFNSNEGERKKFPKLAKGDGYDEIIALLLDHGVSPDAPNDLGFTPLMEAAIWGNAKAASLLLAHGAKPDREAPDGGTALNSASLLGHGEVVEELVKAGASVEPPAKDGTTPILMAACAGSEEALSYLMATPSKGWWWIKTPKGNTYLLAVKTLIKANADVNAAAKNGVTALMAASRAGDVAIVKELLDAGAALHDADGKGRTALMAAVSSGSVPLVQLLLERGADPKAVALDGATALSLAKRGKSPEMVRLIQRATDPKAPEEAPAKAMAPPVEATPAPAPNTPPT